MSEKPPQFSGWPEEDPISEVMRTAYERGQKVKNITFETGKNGQYVNKDRGTKIVIVDRESVNQMTYGLLDAGTAFDVEVIRDTNPSASNGGAYIVKILEAVRMPTDPEAGVVPQDVEPIEVDEEKKVVHVLDIEMPLNTDHNPNDIEYMRSKFEGSYTLDRRTMEAIETVAEAAHMGQSCLLEGETAVSKTSAIEFVAAQTGNKSVRLNLNGQADTSELVGKFVPNDEGSQVRYEELLANISMLNPSSQEILGNVQKEGRALTHMEAQKIARMEDLHVSDWVWKDGLLVKAMRDGDWLILDEANLAEPQILERLNPVLEHDPSIVLSENGGINIRTLTEEEMGRYESGELRDVAPLHPNFRIFGTMNPAEYAGRSAMSPAFKDRWGMYHFVDRPSEQDFSDMVTHMVYGRQPKFERDGVSYQAPAHETDFEKLKDKNADFASFIPRLVKFHTRMEEMARNKEIGRNRREPYIFTRRGLMDCVRFLENKVIVDRSAGTRHDSTTAPEAIRRKAIHRYYLSKMVDSDDERKAKDLLQAVGI